MKYIALNVEGIKTVPKDPEYYEKLKAAVEFGTDLPKEEFVTEMTVASVYVERNNIISVEPDIQKNTSLVSFKYPITIIGQDSESEETIIRETQFLFVSNDPKKLLSELESTDNNYIIN